MRSRLELPRLQMLQRLSRGTAAAAELAVLTGVSTRTVRRMASELAPQVVGIGRARRQRYGRTRGLGRAGGATSVFELFTVGADGRIGQGPPLTLLEPAGCLCALDTLGWPVAPDDAADGQWPGLPYPLYDMQPQGFLGRQFARREHGLLGVSTNPAEWHDDDVVHVLAQRGADVSGHLIMGEPALREYQRVVARGLEPLTPARTAHAYARAAEEALALGVAGSSAAGEFPKFSAARELKGSATPHVIVKFSGVGQSGAVRRWADLLVCEHLALEQVGRMPGVRAAPSRVLQSGGRTFLEVERFDRHGDFGRSALLSQFALNGHLLGLSAQDWRTHAQALAGLGLLDTRAVDVITRLWWFGRLIGNTDMHLGNLSFQLRSGPQGGGLLPAPAYDMLPMAYAPLAGGEIPPRQLEFDLPHPSQSTHWEDACRASLAFWRLAGADERISAAFRAICRGLARDLEKLAARQGLGGVDR